MPATVNNGGDVLARGGVKATWGVNHVSKERWDSIFGEDSGPKPNYSDSDSEPSGVVSVKPRKAKRSSK